MNDNHLPETVRWAAMLGGETKQSLRAALGVMAGLIDDPAPFEHCARAIRSAHVVPARGNFRAVVDDVCQQYGVTWREIVAHDTKRKPSVARQHAMYAAFMHCPHLSLMQIGHLFGRRDHTTIVHGVSAHCKRLGITYDEARTAAGRPTAPAHFLSARTKDTNNAA